MIEGVCVVTGGVEARGHQQYTDETTLQTVLDCANSHADGVKVKANHGSGVDSIIGTLKNFRIEGSKLLADLHLLKSNSGVGHIMEMAETMPGEIGLSIAFSGMLEEIDGKDFARCSELYSVDLVEAPAANPSGLFSVDSAKENKMDNKSLLARFREFLAGVEKDVEPINFEAKATELETQLSAKATELQAKDAKIVELEAAIDTVKTEFAAKEAALAEKETKFEALLESRASQKAQAIAASVGVPPAVVPPAPPINGATQFGQKVQEQMKAGKMSKAQALQFCVKNFPAEYAEWRASGNTQTL